MKVVCIVSGFSSVCMSFGNQALKQSERCLVRATDQKQNEVPRSPEEDQSHSTIPAGALQAAKILGYQCRHNGVNATVNRKQRELQGHGRLNASLATRAHIKKYLARKQYAFGWNKHVYRISTLGHSGKKLCFQNLKQYVLTCKSKAFWTRKHLQI